MKKAIVGKKIGMTQVFTEDGRLVPVTVIEAGPCTVVQTKNTESDGYNAVQVGFGDMTESRAKKLLNKPELGHFKKAGVDAKRVLREFRFDDCSGYKVGDVLKCDQFAQGDKIDITGTSKGQVTVQNLEVVQVDAERNLLLVKGAVPGPNEGLLIIRDTCKA